MRIALVATVALAGLINFFAFACGALLIKGDALNGKIVAGHYFVASHGKYTEVSQAVYTYSLCHVFSVFVTFPLTMLAMAYLALKMMKDLVPKGSRRGW